MRSERLRGPRQFQLVFLATMAVLSATLGWLGWRLLAQDAQFEKQRRAERREAAADAAVSVLEKHFVAVEQDLARVLTGEDPKSPAANGSVVVRVTPGIRQTWPAGGVLYYPDIQEPTVSTATVFDRVDQLEEQGKDDVAMAALRSLAAARSPEIRGLALVRMARNHLKNNRPEQALDAYAQLTTQGAAVVAGMPAAYVGRIGALTLNERQHDRRASDRLARALDKDLQSGRWPIAPATYDYLSGRVAAAVDGAREISTDRVALSDAVVTVWRAQQEGGPEINGRRSISTVSGPVLVVWRSAGPAMAMFAATAAHVTSRWLPTAGTAVTLLDTAGRPVAGDKTVGHLSSATRPFSTTGLPWTVVVDRADDPDADRAFTRRRNLLVAGLVIVLGVIASGAWFVGRSVSRELEAARLQSDFVAAVSHEFRTPLTTLCQLSELLTRGRVASEADRESYYEFLHTESHRLRRLVESLLDFGRLQTGKVEFKLEPVDVAEFLRDTAAAFSQAHPGINHEIIVRAHAGTIVLNADRQALGCALWNLVENAVKYSPDCGVVHVDARQARRSVEIAVRDEGIGIPRDEQRRVFDRFTRGASARERQISGTGLGLATAREIVRAHGGDIVVESEPGRGSTFTIRLPARSVLPAAADDRQSSLAREAGR